MCVGVCGGGVNVQPCKQAMICYIVKLCIYPCMHLRTSYGVTCGYYSYTYTNFSATKVLVIM